MRVAILGMLICLTVACSGQQTLAPMKDAGESSQSSSEPRAESEPVTTSHAYPAYSSSSSNASHSSGSNAAKYGPISQTTQTEQLPVKPEEGASNVNNDARTTNGIHKVRSGDTLHSIGFQYGIDFPSLAQWNGLSAPYAIYVGQSIQLSPPKKSLEISPPKIAETLVPEQKTEAVTAVTVSPKMIKENSIPAEKLDETKEETASASTGWKWPTSGKVVQQFSAASPGKKGIQIQGEYGQLVNAAAEGKVVYSGNGLLGYGNLVIIKHADGFLSAYAHNAELLVKDGDYVKMGAPIAKMGKEQVSGKSILQFEIRKNGTPTNPLPYLGTR